MTRVARRASLWILALVFVAAAYSQSLPPTVTATMNTNLNFGKDLQDGLHNLLNTTIPSLTPYSWYWLGAVSFASFYTVLCKTLGDIPKRYHDRIRLIGILLCLFRVTVASIMLRYYSIPVAGSVSFHQMPTYIGQHLSLMISAAGEKQALIEFNRVIHLMPLPHGLQFIESIGYALILVLFGLAQFGMTFITSMSVLFEGALSVYGLFFVPLFAHISLSGRFWKWWNMMVSYSMYPVTAAIFAYVFAGIYLNFIDKAINHNYAIAHLLLLAAYLMLVTPILILSMFMIPRFNDALFGEVPSVMRGIMDSIQNAAVAAGAAVLL